MIYIQTKVIALYYFHIGRCW